MAERLVESAGAAEPTGNGSRAEPSIADLVRQGTEQISTLVRDEIALARAELSAKARHAGKAAGLLGGAGGLAMYGVAGLLTGVILLLARGMPAYAAAFLVGVVLLLIAGAFALAGRSQLRRAVPPVPTEALRDLRADLDTVSSAVSASSAINASSAVGVGSAVEDRRH